MSGTKMMYYRSPNQFFLIFLSLYHTIFIRMVKPHRAKSKRESDIALLDSLYFQFTCHAKCRWKLGTEPICCNFASEIAFAYALVWLDHHRPHPFPHLPPGFCIISLSLSHLHFVLFIMVAT